MVVVVMGRDVTVESEFALAVGVWRASDILIVVHTDSAGGIVLEDVGFRLGGNFLG